MVLDLEIPPRAGRVFRALRRRDAQRHPRRWTPAAERGTSSALRDTLGWRGVVAAHEAAWASRWQCSDVEVDGDAAAQQALRFAVYHLNSAANPADERVSIGARALTGDDYRGHVFWDTEIFLLPFYILTWPEAARALLMYRFHTLDGARAKAARMGWRGALYAWESADTGAETTPEQVIGPDRQVVDILCGKQEQHISADVAYAVWQYWQATGDDEFLLDAGAEILLETGRFWSSRAQLEADGHHHIRGVIGPDEYHEHIDDNAFTNVMARWNIRRALDVAALLRERWPERWARLASRLGLDDTELKQWRTRRGDDGDRPRSQNGTVRAVRRLFRSRRHRSDELRRPFRANGRGARARADAEDPRSSNRPMSWHCWGCCRRSSSGETGAENFRYYEPRCGHGSSLSRAMHGLVAARLGDSEMALRYFRQTAAIDLADTHVAIDGGVHIAALGGIWLTAVFGFAGLSLQQRRRSRRPATAGSLAQPRLRCPVAWPPPTIRIDQAQHSIEATLESGEEMILAVRGEAHDLRRGQELQVSLVPDEPIRRALDRVPPE